jgi:hypothetical protein
LQISAGHAVAHDWFYMALDLAILGSLGVHGYRKEDEQFQHVTKLHQESGHRTDDSGTQPPELVTVQHYPVFKVPSLFYTPGMYLPPLDD